MQNFLGFTGVQFLINWIKGQFVQKDGTKQLTDENYTKVEKDKLAGIDTAKLATKEEVTAASYPVEDKTKLAGVEAGAQANKIETIKRNGVILPVTSKGVDIVIPTKVSEFVNDKGFQTKAEIDSAIAALKNKSIQFLDELPTKGEVGVIYSVINAESTDGSRNEYAWDGTKFEKVGETSTKVDLTGYVKTTDLKAITTQEIQGIIG